MRLPDKVAIITGGATGIGRACARFFVREGAQVVLFGRRQDRLNEAVEELGPAARAVPGDITCDEDLDRLVADTLEAHGRIDILVNNAGTFATTDLHTMDESLWDNILNINLRGAYHLTRRILPTMMQQRSGSLIHISSILGLIAVPQTAAYNVSKAALNHFSNSLAVEYGSYGIRSNAICPGMIETEMTAELRANTELMTEWIKAYPLGRFGKPEEVGQACLFLASDEASFITGAVLPVDGGFTAQ